MARLTVEQWEQAKADYEIAGLTQRQIAEKYKVSAGAVGQRASKENWETKQETKQDKTNKVNAIIELARIENKTKQELSNVEQAVFDISVADEVNFRLQNDKDMDSVRDKAMELLKGVKRASDVKQIMDTLRIQREARLGKSPDTAIQINNNEDKRPIINLKLNE
ncbi:hypothetical protein [Phocoenobacter skyensis]|uniref:Terminase small subunit n=1 Tax=Phocoenobacter skyensis TaxID=97481 RepID=A0ABT9JIA9_9PAST|nr:hypothetical protein [Pasteurella skyensis]MDP8078348.1 hypothetical protein [Pasteurella skyensis]MDP8084560.1 hypothetical protein [Pasteurella skyensis]